MRVMVTGATGFIGSHAVEALLAAGHQVRLLARTPAKAAARFGPQGVADVDIVAGDMTDRAAVRAAVEGCDALLHSAAVVGVARGDLSATSSNLIGTKVVLKAGLEAGCDPILYTSSMATLYPPHEPMLTVDSPLGDPLSQYGRSKVEAERHVRALQAEGAPIVSFLIGGVFGPDQPQLDSAMAGIVAALSQTMVVPRGGVGVLDVRDLGALFVAALEPGRGPRRYMAGGRFLSWQDWTDLLAEVTGNPIRRLRLPASVIHLSGRAIDLAKRIRWFDYPLTYEAALFMTEAVPTDDRPTMTELGVERRPTAETLADSTRWLIEAGHLRPEHAPLLRV